MGDPERWPEASGLTPEGAQSFDAAFATFLSKGDAWWAKAELRAAELITSLQPNEASEQRRQDVIDYVRGLVKGCIYGQVHVLSTFGSVPLKTYLPDGDIDLSAFTPSPDVKRTWIQDTYNALQKAKDNPNSEFRVKEVQLIHAEVKIVKCFVENILVDVSFDQLGGLGTLCFLVEVDKLIGEDHLFKRSIILVKAWCYYESRILGAHCGLMSTYAVEALVLYIFDKFHASLRGPLQVLYLFLEFFSSFDWDNYCVSLSSPIPLKSLSKDSEKLEDLQKLALSTRRDGGELFFTKEFLVACETEYGVVPVSQITKSNKFTVKCLNISDPLRSSNNLGRSVNQGNFARIRRAFDFGARTLRRVLSCTEEDVPAELEQFFKNCNLRLHGGYQRPDVASPRPCRTKASNAAQKIGCAKREAMGNERSDLTSHSTPFQNGNQFLRTEPNHALPVEQIHFDSNALPGGESSQEILCNDMQCTGDSVQWTHPRCSSLKTTPCREKNGSQFVGTPKSVAEEDSALSLEDRNGSLHCAVSEDPMVSARRGEETMTKRNPVQVSCGDSVNNKLPVPSEAYEFDKLFSGSMCAQVLNNGPGQESRRRLERPDVLVANIEGAGLSKRGTMMNENHWKNGTSSATCNRPDSEEDEECSSQSSSKYEATASEDSTVIVVSGCALESSSAAGEGLLPLPFQLGNDESTSSFKRDSPSALQGRLLDLSLEPRHLTANLTTETQIQTPSHSGVDQPAGLGSEECGCSVSAESHKPTGNGCEYSGGAGGGLIKMPRRKGRSQREHQTGLQGKDLEGSGVIGHSKPRRVSGKSRGGWSVDDSKEKLHSRAEAFAQEGDASIVGSPRQSPVPSLGYPYVHSPRYSSADATGGSPHKSSRSRSHLNAAGPVVRQPVPNYQFDPGTPRNPYSSSGTGTPCHLPVPDRVSSSQSSPPQFVTPFFPGFAPPVMLPLGFSNFPMFIPGMDVPKRNSSAKGDGNNGKNRSGHEMNGCVEAPVETFGDAPSFKSQSKVNESQIAVGIVESLVAVGVPASTSSRRAAARSVDGAEAIGRTTDILQSNLQQHLDSLNFGRYCDYSSSPNLNQVVHPMFALDKRARAHRPWEGPGRPDAALRAQFMTQQFYASGSCGYPYYQPYLLYQLPFWPPRGVELSPRPRGTGTYLPNTQHIRQNIRSKGRGGSQNGSPQVEEKGHHQSRDHEVAYPSHVPHSRTQMNKGETHVQAVYGSTNIVVEIQNADSAKARDPNQPKHDEVLGAPSLHSHAIEPSVSTIPANFCDPPYPKELFLRPDCDLDVTLDAEKLCGSPGSPIPVYPVLNETPTLDPELVSADFRHCREAFPEACNRGGSLLRRSASMGRAYDQTKPDDSAVILTLPRSVGEVLPSTTTQRLPTYQMKEEDFPPLRVRRKNRIDTATGGTNGIANGIPSNLGRYVSL
ncbi:uncharacterized protein [Physcomitrium patens]|uniref:uncharacterized protein isoform X3 n=1 Tax=Physcomitrium patens TaxID=3218 RepID=UPI000D166997|nr:uncharacterized protein LOC112275079 isoform X3 [Physcomitrium patens]|eukprot:XP_024360835.1 uncharacterized protein LOC112275079 isoform X3 [Physcomitrella patens]